MYKAEAMLGDFFTNLDTFQQKGNQCLVMYV
jgi:hypothetical protein